MLRRIQSQLIALATYVVVSFAIVIEIGAALPRWALVAALLSSGAFVLTWVVVLGREQFRQSGALPDAGALRRQSTAFMWSGNMASALGFWLTMPYAESNLRMMNVIFGTSTIAFEMLGTIQRAPQSGRSSLAPFSLSVSIICYFAVFWERFSPLIIFFTIAATYVFWMMRQIAQSAINRSYLAKQEAEAQRDAKTRFLASASHDLGQPLQAARMFFDQAMRSGDGAKRDKAVRGVHLAFDTTEHLLDQMMAHLKLESGVVEARLEQCVIGPLVAQAADINEPAAGLAQVSLHAMPCRLKVLADPALVERALGNLIGNAIRHAKASRILIGARQTGNRVRVWVIDDGCGVSTSDIQRLFDDYVQGSDHGQEIRGGFGLGLATTRRLARLMGGDAGYEAKWVKGSAFWLDLPAA